MQESLALSIGKLAFKNNVGGAAHAGAVARVQNGKSVTARPVV